jgi:acetolactate synthase I/II/III large subunit
MTSSRRSLADFQSLFPHRESSSIAVRSKPTSLASPQNASDAIAHLLVDLGVTQAFGLVGGTVAALCEALARTDIEVVHCRHETGAAFAATEAHFVSDRPTVVFTTSGPGLANALNGLLAARWEGAKVIVISGTTPPSQRGRWAFQETSSHTLPESFFHSGTIFHYAFELTELSQLPQIATQLRAGIAQPGGFVAHLAVPSVVQTQVSDGSPRKTAQLARSPLAPSASTADRIADLLESDPFAIWVGFGARRDAELVRAFAERSGAAVMCSPRAKGLFPEDHHQFVGVTGFAGDQRADTFMSRTLPARILVLGTKLSEFTSFWNPAFVPPKGFVHVDIDPRIPGAAFPEVETEGVHAEIGEFLRAMMVRMRNRAGQRLVLPSIRPIPIETPREQGPVRPQILMQAIQRTFVSQTDVRVIVDAGNAFAWTTSRLRFTDPGRYRVSMGWASMGQAAAGAVGAALASGGKILAIVGDGAMLMQNEINTAVHYGANVVWIVLNDSQYGMIEHGMRGLRMKPVETAIPTVDFAALARSQGAQGITVHNEQEIEGALATAMHVTGPYVIDVIIDRTAVPPMGRRVQNLIEQGVEGKRGKS